MESILKVENLSVGIKKGKNIIPILSNVNFSLNPGSTLGIVGESGCGKSMTCLAIMQLLPFQARIINGSICFKDKNLIKSSENELLKIRGSQISMVFQDPMTSLNPSLTIGEQIIESLIIHKNIQRHKALEMAGELLELVGIPSAKNRLNNYPHQLSGGMRQRVMVAIAVACKPKIVIADEPTTALDVTIQAQIISLLENLRKDLGTSIILITHDLGLIAGFAKEVVVMYAGQVVEIACIEELFYNPQHPYTIGLLGSLPTPHRQGQKLLSIPGTVPNPSFFPKGCRFHPRCQYATNECKNSVPPWHHLGENHRVSCWKIK